MEILENNDYKKSVSKAYRAFKCTDTLFQKTIRDEHGVKYYVNAWYYPQVVTSNHLMPESVQFESQLRNGDRHVDISPYTRDYKEAEETIETVWKALEMGYVKIYGE